MNYRLKLISTAGLLVSLLYISGSAQQNTPKIDDNADISTIDPNNPQAGDFLFDDIRQYAIKAGDYYRSGDFENAIRYYLYVLSRDASDYTSIYNLACCYALMGKGDLAGKYLQLAVESGFNDYEFIRQDSDFNKVRGQTAFDSVIDSINAREKEEARLGGDLLFFDAFAIFQCRVRLPENYDKTKQYPLVVGLHGYSGNADRFIRFYQRFESPEFIFAVPYAPYHYLDRGRIAYSWNLWLPGDEEFPGSEFDITENYITGLVKQLKRRYNVGDVYLMGHSQGAAVTYITGIKHHELFKGLIALAGPLSPFWVDEKTFSEGNHLNILTVHGKNDRTFDIREGLAARNTLRKYGYDVKFIEFDGDHRFPPDEIMHQVEQWIESDK